MVAPINLIGNYLSPIAEIRRINLTEPQQSTVEARRNALIESNQLRKSYITGLENYIKLQEESVQLHKEHRQLLQESKAITQKQIDVTKSLIADLQEIKRSRREAVMSLFDKKPSVTPKVEESAKSTSKPVSHSSFTKEERVAARAEKTEKSNNTPVVSELSETKKQTTGKVFDYVPKTPIPAQKQEQSVVYKPTQTQVSAEVVSTRKNNTPKIEESKVPAIDLATQRMIKYSQKNLWESIIAASVSSKLV